MDPGIELRRYMHLGELEDMLRHRRLQFTRIDKYRDPFEGSVPKQQIDDQVLTFSSANFMRMQAQQRAAYFPDVEQPRFPYRDDFAVMAERRRALTRSAHASCWTAGPESEAMWRLYCEDDGAGGRDGPRGQGVAVRSTLARVEASAEPLDLVVSPITYRLYHEGPAFSGGGLLDQLLHKRLGFECEREVRLLTLDEQHFNALNAELSWQGTFGPKPPKPAELAERIPLPWNVLDVADAIAVGPESSLEYEQRVRALVSAIAPRGRRPNRAVSAQPAPLLGELLSRRKPAAARGYLRACSRGMAASNCGILPPLQRSAARKSQQTTPQAGPRYHTYFRVSCRQQLTAVKLEFGREAPSLGDEPNRPNQALQCRPSAIYVANGNLL